MKKLKLRIAKFDRMLVVEGLEIEGEWEATEHIGTNCGAKLSIHRMGCSLCKTLYKEPNDIERFSNNEERDEYAANLVKWITEEQFGGSGKLEIGKPCLVKNYEYIEWRKRFYAGKVAKQLGMDKRYLAYENPELDKFSRWKYAKPLNPVQPKIDGEIYTWEAEE